MYSSKHRFLPPGVVIVEDQPILLESLQRGMLSALEGVSAGRRRQTSPAPLDDEMPRLVGTDNLVDASRAIRSGQCDVLIADYRINAEPGKVQGKVDCLPLLRDIKRRKACVMVFIHTAYKEQLDQSNDEQLAFEAISKIHDQSTELVIERGKQVWMEIEKFRGAIWGSFEKLQEAAEAGSPVDQQSLLVLSREAFSKISVPSWAPPEYLRAIGTIKPLLFRLSSVPSKTFRLAPITTRFVETLRPVIEGLCSPLFSFTEIAAPAFQTLEALGYDVFMRIDDE